MAVENLIQILRSNVTATPSSLEDGQMAWSGVSNTAFIGDFGVVTPIGGEGLLTRGFDVIANNITAQTAFTIDAYTVTDIIDDGGMTTTSNTSLATSESIKTYVDSVAGAGVSNFNDISDVSVSTAANNELIVYDATSGDWENHTISGTSGISVSFVAQDITVSLDDTAVTGGSYGDANTVGTFTVGSDGRLTAAGSADINHDTLLNFVANEHVDHSSVNINAGNGLSGGGSITASRTLTVGAGNGINTNATHTAVHANTGLIANTTGLHVDTSVIAQLSDLPANTSVASAAWADANNTLTLTRADASTTDVVISFSEYLQSTDINSIIGGTGVAVDQPDLVGNNVTISIGQDVAPTADVTFNDVSVTGNLVVTGTTTVVDTVNLTVEDPLIKLASNNTTDTVDIGFYGSYNDGGGQEYSGLFRDTSDDTFKLFDSLTVEPTTVVDTANASFNLAGLSVGPLTADSLSLTTNLAVSDGGTGVGTFVTNGILYGNGTGAIQDTAAGTQYQVLQAGSGGVPEWGSLDGGTF